MLTERVPDVSVEEVEAAIPSGSTNGIDLTSVLGPVRSPCHRGSGEREPVEASNGVDQTRC